MRLLYIAYICLNYLFVQIWISVHRSIFPPLREAIFLFLFFFFFFFGMEFTGRKEFGDASTKPIPHERLRELGTPSRGWCVRAGQQPITPVITLVGVVLDQRVCIRLKSQHGPLFNHSSICTGFKSKDKRGGWPASQQVRKIVTVQKGLELGRKWQSPQGSGSSTWDSEGFTESWGPLWYNRNHCTSKEEWALYRCVCIGMHVLSCPTLCNPMALQPPLSVEFFRQEYWSGWPFLESPCKKSLSFKMIKTYKPVN